MAERSPGYFQLLPVAAKFFVYPIDRARMSIQTQWAPAPDMKTVVQWNGVWAEVFQSLRLFLEKGQLQPWRGFGTTCLRWGPYQYLNLASKDKITRLAPCYSREQHWGKYFTTKLLVGASAGVFSALVWGYPLDVIRQHLATNSEKQEFRYVVSRVWKNQGLRGFYRGFFGDCAGLAIFRGVQLGGWDVLKEWYGKDAWHRKSTSTHFLHAQAISILASFSTYPVDTIRRNVIRSRSGISYIACIRACLCSGVKMGGGCRHFFYAGFSARIASSFVNGIVLECWDIAKLKDGSH